VATYAGTRPPVELETTIEFRPRGALVYAVIARIRDIVLSGFSLIVLAPLFAVVMVAAAWSTRSSAFFKQVRVGKDGRFFTVFKIRTLKADAPAQALKGYGETMATPLGRILRRYKLDEIPQLWNVLKGEMSLVGPRPEMPFIVETYTPVQRVRLFVKPGLTGMWQLSRVREREIHRYIEYDLFYLANRSTGFDLWLIWRTTLLILFSIRTKVRTAASLWERDPTWRRYVADRGRAIPRRTGPLLSNLWALGVVVLLALVTAPAIGQAVLAKNNLEASANAMFAAREAARGLEPGKLDAALNKAEMNLNRAETRLNSWTVLPAKLIPGVRGNLVVPAEMAAAARELVAAGRGSAALLEAVPFESGRLIPPWNDGVLDVESLALASESARRIQQHVAKAHRIVSESHGALLLPPVKQARTRALGLISEARREADVGAAAAFLMPRMFGAEQARTWVIAAENTAELRGRGGYFGSLGTAVADEGRLTLGDFTATGDLPELKSPSRSELPDEYVAHYLRVAGASAWQNLTMSPNFPSGAKVLLSSLDRSGVVKGDGVIALDPKALEYLLEVTGPVQVPGLPVEISSKNVVAWSLNQAYFEFEGSNDARREALSGIAEAVWKRLVTGKDLDTRRLAEALGRSLTERRIVLYSGDADEQNLIERLGIAGEVKGGDGDYLLVLGQNLGENKMDYYLHRSLAYSGEVRADGLINSKLDITVENTLPPGTHVPGYIGGERPRIDLTEGAARTYLSIYVPESAVLVDASIDDRRTTNIDNRVELGKRLIVANIDVRPGEKRKVSLRYQIPNVIVDGRYQLTVQNQATVHPDQLTIDVKAPRKSRIDVRRGFFRGDSLNWQGTVTSDIQLNAEIRVPWPTRIAARIGSFLRRPLNR
jgi:lipopolysaccharide/colanic/teichoic acid biosynthesis glycosyltransferase